MAAATISTNPHLLPGESGLPYTVIILKASEIKIKSDGESEMIKTGKGTWRCRGCKQVADTSIHYVPKARG